MHHYKMAIFRQCQACTLGERTRWTCTSEVLGDITRHFTGQLLCGRAGLCWFVPRHSSKAAKNFSNMISVFQETVNLPQSMSILIMASKCQDGSFWFIILPTYRQMSQATHAADNMFVQVCTQAIWGWFPLLTMIPRVRENTENSDQIYPMLIPLPSSKLTKLWKKRPCLDDLPNKNGYFS